MRGVVFTGDREVEMRALPDPRPGQSLLYLGLPAGTGAATGPGAGAPGRAHSENRNAPHNGGKAMDIVAPD